MSQSQSTLFIDAMLDPLSHCINDESSKRLIELQIDPMVQQRISTLAERTNNGLLTMGEKAEYEVYIDIADFIAILKLKAQHHLRQK